MSVTPRPLWADLLAVWAVTGCFLRGCSQAGNESPPVAFGAHELLGLSVLHAAALPHAFWAAHGLHHPER